MRRQIAIIFATFLAIYAQSGVLMESIRSTGMGGASVALADDAYGAATNPAGLFQLKRMQISAGYTKFFAGLDVGSLSEGNFFFAPLPGKYYAYSIAGSYFMHDIYSQMELSFSFGRKLVGLKKKNGFLSLAITGKLFRAGYNLNNAIYDTILGDDPNDPLWNSGTSKIAVGADISIFGRLNNAAVGLKISNLNEPNIAISGVESGALPRKLRAGFSYEYRGQVLGALDFETPLRSATVQDPMKLAFGVEGKLLQGKILLRGGYALNLGTGGKSALHLGFGLRTLGKHNVGFDYALVLPQGDISGHPHHRFGVIYGFPVPPPKDIDLVVFPESLRTHPKILRPDSVGIIEATIANLGKDKAKKFYIRTFYYDEQGNYGLIDRRKIPELKGGQDIKLQIEWVPPHEGKYDVYVSVDDKSEKGKERKGQLPDVNEENNIAHFEVAVFNPPYLKDNKPQLLKTLLRLAEINYIREEMPMVPFVFFDEADSTVPERFFSSMQVIAKRLEKNPNVALVLRGYVDAPTEKKKFPDLKYLAAARARALKRYLMDMGVPERQIIVQDPSEYDYTQPRAGKKNRKPGGKFEKMIAEENRRVEISTEIIDFPDSILICCVNYRVGEVDIPPEGKLEVENSMRLTKDLLERNPDIIILFHGMSSPEDSAKWDRAFERAVKVRNYAGQLVSKKTSKRMMVYATAPDSADMVKIIMSGDAVVYRPRGSVRASQGFQIAAREKNKITLEDLRVDAGVDTYYLAIVDDDMEEFRLLAAGHGFPPTEITWDWRGNDGEPPEPDKNYYAYLYLKDNVGQELKAKSDPVRINVTRQEKREELIIVNFTFGGTFPKSPYLEGRLERIASDFIQKAVQKKQTFKVIIGGHTDIIGNPAVNLRLSLERAKREERNLRQMLIALLKLKDNKELDMWLAEHNVSIEVRGYGSSRPYKVRIWERGYFRDVLIGNNDYPEGRFVNRRVTMEYEILRRHSGR